MVGLLAVFGDLFQAKFAIVLSDNPVALAGGVFKFLAVHDLYYTIESQVHITDVRFHLEVPQERPLAILIRRFLPLKHFPDVVSQ